MSTGKRMFISAVITFSLCKLLIYANQIWFGNALNIIELNVYSLLIGVCSAVIFSRID